mgnify:CR=1 FL=1
MLKVKHLQQAIKAPRRGLITTNHSDCYQGKMVFVAVAAAAAGTAAAAAAVVAAAVDLAAVDLAAVAAGSLALGQ